MSSSRHTHLYLLTLAACCHAATDYQVAERCNALLFQWRVGEARAVAEKAVEERNRYPADLFTLAQVRFFEARYQEALDLMREAKGKARFGKKGDKFEHHVEAVCRTASTYTNTDSPHFSLRFDQRKDAVLVEPALVCLEKAYRAVGEDLGFEPDERIIVEIWPDGDSFASATTLSKDDIDRSGTIAICKFNRLMITSPRVTLHGYRWQDTLCHEYVHYVLMKKTRNRTPLWLHEGIAKYEETRWRSPKGGRLDPLYASLLAEALRKDALVSFEKMHPTFAKLSGREASLAFAQVGTMVDLIVEKKGLRGLRRILDALRDGYSTDDAFRLATGVDVAGFQEVWLKHVKGRKLTPVAGLAAYGPRLKRHPDGKAREGEDIEELQTSLSKPVADYVLLGDMLRKENRPKAAVLEYQKADTAAGTLSPIIRTRIAFAHAESHDFPAAEKAVADVQKAYPSYQPALAILGSIHYRQRAYAKAVDALEEAIAINPFDFVSRSTLVDAYERTGQVTLAQKQKEAIRLILRRTQG